MVNWNLRYSGSITIPLTGDISTDSLLVKDFSSVIIQFTGITGTNGSPTYTLQSSVTDVTTDFEDYDTITTGLDITQGIRFINNFKAKYIRLVISMNGNTTGSCNINLVS